MRHFGVGIDCDRVLLAHISFSLIYSYALPLVKLTQLPFTNLCLCSAVHSRRVRFTQHSGSVLMGKAIETKQ
jgi:hypothetical protein